MNRRAPFILAVVLAFGAAIGGAMIGRTFINPPHVAESELHQLLHEQLHLDHDQSAKIEAIEQRFALRKAALELNCAPIMPTLPAPLRPSMATDRAFRPQSINPIMPWVSCKGYAGACVRHALGAAARSGSAL
jgi:hypothetical protein